MAPTRKILLVNHFGLKTVSGTTVMFDEILRLAPAVAPSVRFVYESQDRHPSADLFRQHLDAAHGDADCVIAINAHIEVYWPLSEALFAWTRARRLPAYLYVHDYWPHHRDGLLALAALGARPIASTPFVARSIGDDGVAAEVIEVGVPLPDRDAAPREPPAPPTVATAGRLVPRKRFVDLVRAFAAAGVEGRARLYLRLLASNVFDPAADEAQLAEITAEIARLGLGDVILDRRAGERPPYDRFAAYACPSAYEGFSMAAIESAFAGCPPLLSDIPPHVRIAQALFGTQAGLFLFPTGDATALGHLIRDEIATRRRRALLVEGLGEIRATIRRRWSLANTTRALASLTVRSGTARA